MSPQEEISILPEEAPPPYSALEEPQCQTQSHTTNDIRVPGPPEHASAPAKHSHEIWESDGSGLSIHQMGRTEPLFSVILNDAYGCTALTLCRQDGRRNATVAQARLPSRSHDFEISVTQQHTPAGNDSWARVTGASAGVFKSGSYHFAIHERQLAWKRTHSGMLGSSRFSGHDLKLVDESPPETRREGQYPLVDQVLAVYLQHGVHGATGKPHMQVDWREEVGETVEAAALVVLMAVLEKGQRHVRAAATAHEIS